MNRAEELYEKYLLNTEDNTVSEIILNYEIEIYKFLFVYYYRKQFSYQSILQIHQKKFI